MHEVSYARCVTVMSDYKVVARVNLPERRSHSPLVEFGKGSTVYIATQST